MTSTTATTPMQIPLPTGTFDENKDTLNTSSSIHTDISSTHLSLEGNNLHEPLPPLPPLHNQTTSFIIEQSQPTLPSKSTHETIHEPKLIPIPPTRPTPKLDAWKSFLFAQHMPIGLFISMLIGFFWPAPGIAAGNTPLPSFSLVGIFFIAGLNLTTSDIMKLFKAKISIFAGLVSILVLSPLLSLLVARIPLTPREFALGLGVFLAMPTTTSTGVLITDEAGGNVPLSLAFSVLTNVIAVFTSPITIAFMFGESGIRVDVWQLLRALALTVLLPLFIGKLCRSISMVMTFATRFKIQLKLVSSVLLICVPWIMMSRSSVVLRATSFNSLLLLLVVATVLHLILMALNIIGSYFLQVPQPDKVSIVIMSSQKTINLAAAIILSLPSINGLDPGLIVLSCIFSHFIQTIIDAVLGSWWGKRTKNAIPKIIPVQIPPPTPMIVNVEPLSSIKSTTNQKQEIEMIEVPKENTTSFSPIPMNTEPPGIEHIQLMEKK